MDPAKPSLELVRSVTDEHVLRALMRHRRLTRAELATEVGISKPTAGESVRRLTERGLVADTGERTPGGRGRGRVGSYYALAPGVGTALAVVIAPEGIVAERIDIYGETVARAARPIDRPAHPSQVAAAVRAAAEETFAPEPSQVAAAVRAAAEETFAPEPSQVAAAVRAAAETLGPSAAPESRQVAAVVRAAAETLGPSAAPEPRQVAAVVRAAAEETFGPSADPEPRGEQVAAAALGPREGRVAAAGAEPVASTTREPRGGLTAAAAAAARDQDAPVARLAVVSAADPVDRTTGRLIQLPDAPFLVGELDPVAVLAPFADGPVIVDNDVNWAARAERDHAGPERLRDFAYLYLGEGLGCAIINDGEVRRGGTGLTGEIAHLLTAGPDGRAVPFIDVFGVLDLRRPESTAIDVDRLLARPDTHEALGTAVSGVIAAVVALADPQEVVIGGAWGPALSDAIRAAVARMPRRVPIRTAALTEKPIHTGVRHEALTRLRALVTASAGAFVTLSPAGEG